ncbi:uncharacterized protein K452DRAFT_285419 [Aplosporella prunicola CBS 121167]|uniref:DUF300-domain-containing protein n=1 Tax=Aplosporella prunicola CBS 121167 TaxID=1176127 RepID=A0A6A6BJ55_9PEZI|nr:uncharacterized protein K452DRAFT_285419 [Aplosporella prunicola CBS 121167]KAF2144182.1 hypothetical protein K452DRAFT_285419 [Aplosporella prunicola CBS 121167]
MKCPEKELKKISEEDVWSLSGTELGVNFHTIGEIIGFVFSAISIGVSLYLIFRHATHYSRPWEQRQTIRILFMIPIYATVSLLSFHYYQKHVYFEVMRDCYEAFAISSFFALLCNYVAPSVHEQKEYFRHVEPLNWVWPLTWAQKISGGENKGWLRKPRSGLTWFNVIWISVFQYCFIRVFFTFVAVVAQYYEVLCEDSWSPAFAEVYIEIFQAGGVTIAMYCVIQFYIQLKPDLAQHSPFLKVLAIKLVIFFCFWQGLLIDFLTNHDILTTSDYLAYADIKVGIPSLLVCVEMAFFAVLHLFAFPWKPYRVSKTQVAMDPNYTADPDAPLTGEKRPKRYKGGIMGLGAIIDAFNIWDVVKASARGFRWLFVGVRHRHEDASYQKTGLTTQASALGPVEMTDQSSAYQRTRTDSRTRDGYGDEFDRRSSIDADDSPGHSPFEHPDERRGRVQQDYGFGQHGQFDNAETSYGRGRVDSDAMYGPGNRQRSPDNHDESDELHLLSHAQPQPTKFV